MLTVLHESIGALIKGLKSRFLMYNGKLVENRIGDFFINIVCQLYLENFIQTSTQIQQRFFFMTK